MIVSLFENFQAKQDFSIFQNPENLHNKCGKNYRQSQFSNLTHP